MKTKDKNFTERVRDIVRKIPRGKTMTYRDVATRQEIQVQRELLAQL